MELVFLLTNLFLLAIAIIALIYLQKINVSFSIRSMLALLFGILIGTFIHYAESSYLGNHGLVFSSLEVYRVIAEIYINLLKAMVYPLIIVAVLTALTKVDSVKDLSKYGILLIIFLLAGVAIAALISMVVMYVFNLTNGVTLPSSNLLSNISSYQNKVPNNLADIIINFAPINPFLDLTGVRSSSTIAVVIFVVLLGISYLWVKNNYPEEGEFFQKLINSLYRIIMRLVTIVLRLTPYGILALITIVLAKTSVSSLLSLLNFIACTFVAITIMLIVQSIIIALFGFKPTIYYKKTFPLLSFAFFGRSSSASIPLGVTIQTNKLGVNPVIANLSTSLGSTIGQAGCVGVYATMVVFLTASAIGINPWHFDFIVYTVFIITITSLGVGGIGGGAIYAALIALSTFNFPVALLALLIPIEAILDMARTMLNVNGLTVSALLTSKVTKTNNKDIYNNTNNID